MTQENQLSASTPETSSPTPPCAEAPPPPDIKRDRIVVIDGGLSFALDGVMVHMADPAPAWLTLVPVEPYEVEKADPSKVYPRERHVRILHEMRIGTVDELAEDYREKLTRVFNALAMRKPDGTHDVIPMFGEASMRKQTEVLARHGLDRLVVEPLKVERKVFLERQARREALEGFQYRQDAFERDVLMRLVATYLDRRFSTAEQGEKVGYGAHPPTDAVDCVQRLIDALTTLRDDRKALEDRRTARQADQKIDIPQSKENVTA